MVVAGRASSDRDDKGDRGAAGAGPQPELPARFSSPPPAQASSPPPTRFTNPHPTRASNAHPSEPSAEPRRTLRLDLEYDGTEFLGWQRQAEGRTVQAEVETALARILGSPHTVVGAGRTDAGTHARGMIASFRTTSDMDAGTVARALDAVLPPDVGVLRAYEMPDTFHARRDAAWKWYRYSLLLAPRTRPLLRRTTWAVRGRLDRNVLDAGAVALRGRHDFQTFASQGSPRKTTVRTLLAATWTPDEDRLHFDVVGDGFLYRMVRSIVGTLVDWARGGGVPRDLARVVSAGTGSAGVGSAGVGSAGVGSAGIGPARAGPGSRSDVPGAGHVIEAGRVGEVLRWLLDGRDRALAGPVAPARGLCLMAVGADPEASGAPLPPFLLKPVESALRHSTSGGPP